jgi:outer membrane protein assembly factor BamB
MTRRFLKLASAAGTVLCIALTANSSHAQTYTLSRTFLSPTPGNTGNGERFGYSVDISENRILIGEPGDDTGAEDSGIAYLFDANTGGLLQTFLNPEPEFQDFFGSSVLISGDRVIIGNPWDRSPDIESGSVYLFDANTGGLLQTFVNPTPDRSDIFGYSIAFSNDRVLIGAPGDNDLGVDSSGAAYLFDANTGNLLRTFFNPTPSIIYGNFGNSVALVDNQVLIGAPGNNYSGAAYLFDANTGSLLQTFLDPMPPGVQSSVGRDVALSGNRALISGTYSDAAYLFDITTGSLLQTFLHPNPEDRGFFGGSIALSDNYALIGDASDFTAADYSGAAYLFDTTTGNLLQTFLHPNPVEFEGFGNSVALFGNRLLIGALDDRVAGQYGTGAAYLYELTSPTEVPEPGMLIGLAAVGLSGLLYKRHHASNRA